MWISRFDLKCKIESAKNDGMLEAYAISSKGNKNYIELIESCADLLGYENKKKKVNKTMYAQILNYSCVSLDRFEYETKTEFIERLISEDKEKNRLIALAEEVEKGNTLRKEKNK